jgi:hypothetical protein
MGIVQSWNWNFGDGTTSTEQNPVHTYATEGLYTVTLSVVTLDGCESTISFEIYIGDDSPWVPELDCQALFIPMPDSIGGNGIQFFDLSYAFNPIQSWSWDFGDGTSRVVDFRGGVVFSEFVTQYYSYPIIPSGASYTPTATIYIARNNNKKKFTT